MRKNTTPEIFDNIAEPALTQDEILMNERDILDGLLKAGFGIDDTDNYRKVSIRRKGKVLFEFRVRPITEEETALCMRRATPTVKNKNIKPETNWAKFRSHIIYTATVDEDRKKVWDNKSAMESFSVFQGVDLVDKVLFAGEKSRVIDIIDEISDSFDDSEIAGN